MKVNGFVKISLSLNVYDLETDAVYIDRYGFAGLMNRLFRSTEPFDDEEKESDQDLEDDEE